MTARDVIAGVLKPLIRNEMRWPNDRDANLRALVYADALIAAGVTMPECGGQCCTHVTGDDDG